VTSTAEAKKRALRTPTGFGSLRITDDFDKIRLQILGGTRQTGVSSRESGTLFI
jgi:hypothetical protein